MAVLAAHERRSGQGPRAAHLIHCNLSSGKAWEPLAAELADDLSMCAVDMLGQGQSPMPVRDRDYQLQIAEASIAVLDRDGTGPQDLIGHSFGACVALRIVSMRPDLVRSLVLFDPVFFGLLSDAHNPAFDRIVADEKPFYRAIAEGRLLDAAENFLTRWGLPGQWEKMPPVVQQGFAEKLWLIELQRGSIIEDNDWRVRLDDLRRLECPTLVMHGANSPAVMAQMTQVLVGAIPGAVGEELAGAGHMLPITHAAQCAARMRRFWGI